ncbi:MAG: NTP transferase domain-containing protein [Candidatus Thorarchaeota archaeon]
MVGKEEFEALILAAGSSSRFRSVDGKFKKCFLKLRNSNILGYIIVGMIKSGITRIKIVTSKIISNLKYKKKVLKSIGHPWRDTVDLKLEIIENNYPERENGYSLLLGLNSIRSENTLLAMADHVFSQNIFSTMIKNYREEDIFLATDPMNSKGIYRDIGDATKVFGEGSSIFSLGKGLKNYNRLDMGVFILKTKNIRKICKKVESIYNKFGVTSVVLSAINLDLNIKYIDFPSIIWLDIDNYKKYHLMEKLFNKSSKIHPFGLSVKDYLNYIYKKNFMRRKLKLNKKNKRGII